MILLVRLRVENFKLLRQVDIAFPRQGSILIEGLNESGKSTLFESVFFALYGSPLVIEGRGKGGQESAIRHGAESASVELLLEVDATGLEVRRTLKRGRSAQASLVIRRAGAPEERVSGVQAVNARLIGELGGLDGEALQNSCFVEQKKLSKLEELGAGERRDSLRKLLNLERMTALADRFRVTAQDERVLAEARGRLELATAAAALPTLSAERAEVESFLRTVVPDGLRGAEREARIAEARRELEDGLARAHDGTNARFAPTGTGKRSGAMARLEAVRTAAGRARRRAVLLAGAGLAALALGGGLTLGGAEGGVWLLPAAPVLGVLVASALQSAREMASEAASLESDLAVWRDTLVAKIGELEGRQRSIRERLGVEGAAPDPEESRRAVEAAARRIEVKRRAATLLEGTLERIVRTVLPNTERNLAQILPLLTAGRYHEARIGEDYQIQVWDDSAGRYVSKSLFSGGARDQFALALRLAFALATLPQELGTTPGFLFLDEPLSSFDGPRTEALVELLTSGQVAANFRQIFVISHNRSFDVRAFQYRLVLREGRVVESNL